MKAGFKEFLKGSVKQLQGDQDDFRKHAMKANCREHLRKEARARRAKRKAIKAAKRSGR